MARLVLLCVVLALSTGSIKPYPVECKIDNNYSDDSDDWQNSEIMKFPTPLKNGMTIELKGTRNLTDPRFVAVLKGADENICEIQYNIETSKIRVYYTKRSISPQRCYEEIDYDIGSVTDGVTYFRLTIQANVNHMSNERFLHLGFEPKKDYGFGVVPCPIKDLNNIEYVQIKQGVKNMTSMVVIFNDDV